VDVVVDSLGGPISLRSFRVLRPGGRLVVFGRYDTLRNGRKDWVAVIKWYAAIAAVWAWDKVSPRRRVLAYHVQKYRDRATRRGGAVGGEPMDADQFREDFDQLVRLLRVGSTRSSPSGSRWPKRGGRMSCCKARRRKASWCSFLNAGWTAKARRRLRWSPGRPSRPAGHQC
jgi:hypothetical protein